MSRRIGCDLDGTLALHYWPHEGEYNPYRIGRPIPKQVERIKQHLANGDEVVIFTARVAPNGSWAYADNEDVNKIRQAIREWTFQHIGQALEATCIKDYRMEQFYDDRAVQIIQDTGVRADGKP